MNSILNISAYRFVALDDPRFDIRTADGRNALDRDAWEAAGWAYRALGRRAG